MGSFTQSVGTAFSLIFSADREVYAAVWTSVSTAGWSTVIASLFGRASSSRSDARTTAPTGSCLFHVEHLPNKSVHEIEQP